MFRKTVRTKLMKKKLSLSALLHETIQRQWDEIKSQMFKFPYFDKWTDQMVHQCCVHSNTLSFEENDLIYVKDDANVYVTYFILERSATVIQRLVVDKYKLKGDKRYRYKLHPNQNLQPSERTHKTEFVFMQTCLLKQGACFGLGEVLSNHTLKANKGLKCLVVPKHIIHQNFTPNNIWKRIILFLDMNYPSVEEVFKMFVAGREWHLDSKELNRMEKFSNRHPLGTTVHDVPLSVRCEDIFLANRFKMAEKDPYYLFGEKYRSDDRKFVKDNVISVIDVKDLPELREAEKRRQEEVDKAEELEELKKDVKKKVSIAENHVVHNIESQDPEVGEFVQDDPEKLCSEPSSDVNQED
uniref:UDP-N-acetylmuramate--L-alanine ligase n=2 Tax=Lygus hesperus TaxID=30085 RepID=A0A0A9ZFB3_LYGHE